MQSTELPASLTPPPSADRESAKKTSQSQSTTFNETVMQTTSEILATLMSKSQSTEVQAICNAVWTDAVKTAYQTMIDAQEA